MATTDLLPSLNRKHRQGLGQAGTETLDGEARKS